MSDRNDGHLRSDRHTELLADVSKATEIIAPLWPLTSFVAVNPLVGLQHLPFDDATAVARRWLRARTHLTLAAFREAHGRGATTDADLRRAIIEVDSTLASQLTFEIGEQTVDAVEIVRLDLLVGPDDKPRDASRDRLGRTDVETVRTVSTSVRPSRSRLASRGLSSGPTRRSNRTISTASTVCSPISKVSCDASVESTSMMARRRSASVVAPRPWASRNAASVRWVRARNHRRATAVASSKGRCCRPTRGLTATKLVSGQSGAMISVAFETSARSSVWRSDRRWPSFRSLMSIVSIVSIVSIGPIGPIVSIGPAPRAAEAGGFPARALPRSNCLGSSAGRLRAPR